MPSLSPAHSSCVCLLPCALPDKVNDPVMAVQIAWMMEVPQLYRLCYDKPFQLKPAATGYERPPVNAATRDDAAARRRPNSVRIWAVLEFSEESAKENANDMHFHPPLTCDNKSLVHLDKQLVVLMVVLILLSDVIKSFHQQRTQRPDVITRVPVKI